MGLSGPLIVKLCLPSILPPSPLVVMADEVMAEEVPVVEMRNWETNTVVGYWLNPGPIDLDMGFDGLVSDNIPYHDIKETAADGTVTVVDNQMVPVHMHPAGYAFLRLPGSNKRKNKVHFHRQLWQDLHQAKLQEGEEIHHVNGDRKGNTSTNLPTCKRRQA